MHGAQRGCRLCRQARLLRTSPADERYVLWSGISPQPLSGAARDGSHPRKAFLAPPIGWFFRADVCQVGRETQSGMLSPGFDEPSDNRQTAVVPGSAATHEGVSIVA